MSAEEHRTNLVHRASLWRFLGDISEQTSGVLHAVARAVDKLGMAAFYMEADAARQYRDLTGIDLGQMVAEPNRYDEVVKVRDEEDE